MGVKHIAFDVWGTILKGNPAYANARAEIIQTIWLPNLSIDAIKEVFATCKRLFDSHEYTFGTSIPYDFKQILLLRELGLAFETHADFRWKSLFNELFLMHSPTLIHPDIPDLIRNWIELEGGTSIISNTHFIPGKVMRKMLFNVGVVTGAFDRCLFSDELQFCKPSPKIFQSLEQYVGMTFNITPEETLMVGNDLVLDIDPAEKAGWQTLHITEPDSWLKLTEKLNEDCSTQL